MTSRMPKWIIKQTCFFYKCLWAKDFKTEYHVKQGNKVILSLERHLKVSKEKREGRYENQRKTTKNY